MLSLFHIMLLASPTCDTVKSVYQMSCCDHDNLSERIAACPRGCSNSYLFSYTDTDDVIMYPKFAPMLMKIAANTGSPVAYVGTSDTTADVRTQTAQIAAISTGKVPKAIDCAGFEPLAIMTDLNGNYGYTSIIVTRKDSGITSLADIAGKTLGVTSPSSNSGYLIPTAQLTSVGLTAGVDYNVTELTYHPAVLSALKNGDVVVGALGSVIPAQVINGVYAQYGHTLTQQEWDNDYDILWESASFPTTAFGVHFSLSSDVKTQIQNGFLSTIFNGTTMGESYGHDQKFSVATSNVWDPVRAVQSNLHPYDCSQP